MTTQAWFNLRSSDDDPSSAEIVIDGIIGTWGDEYFGDGVTTARSFTDQLEQLPDAITTLRVRVHSPGGDPFAGVAIANALRDQRVSKGRKVDVCIDGLAASAASIVVMAGDTIRIADNALVMIHDPYAFAVGDADELETVAESLRAIKGSIIATYKWHAKKSEAELAAMMSQETWLSADEAIEAGFATEKIAGATPKKTKASARAMARLKVPDALQARVAAFFEQPVKSPVPLAPAAALEVVKACAAGGCPELAMELLESGVTGEQLKVKVNARKDAKAAAAARASSIATMCSSQIPNERAARLLTETLVESAMSVDQVKGHLLIVTALIDSAIEIDGRLDPAGDGPRHRHAQINSIELYAERNRPRASQ